jgi:hypothetical protein
MKYITVENRADLLAGTLLIIFVDNCGRGCEARKKRCCHGLTHRRPLVQRRLGLC